MTKRRLISQLPTFLQTDDLKSFFGGTVDEIFQPGTSESISGYIGHQLPIYGICVATTTDTPSDSIILEVTTTNGITMGQVVNGVNIATNTIVVAIADQLVRLNKPVLDSIAINTPMTFSDSEFYISESTPSRQAYQLESGMISRNSTGVIDNALTYPDLINYLSTQGAIVSDHQRLFETEYYSWAPPINIDMLANYHQYYWFGDVSGGIDLPSLVLTIPIKRYVGDGFTTSYELPNSIVSVPLLEETASIYVDGRERVDFTISENLVALDTPPALGSHIMIARVFDYASTIDGKLTVDVSDINTNGVMALSSGMRVEINDMLHQIGVWDTWEGSLDSPQPPLHAREPYHSEGGPWDYYYFRRPDQDHAGIWDRSGGPFYMVDGIGQSLRLTEDNSLIRRTEPQYVTIDRSSRQRNLWSLHNGWVHKDTFTWSHRSFPDRQARRPIIEFVRDIVLYPGQVWQESADPLFMLYDLNGNPFNDPGLYPASDFKGNRIFGYLTGSAPTDPTLHRSLSFDKNGYIMFQADITTAVYYYILGPQSPITPIVRLPCYQLDDNITKSIEVIWNLSEITTTQHKSNGFYDVPLNLQANPNSLDVTTLSRSTYLDHFKSIISNQLAIGGQALGDNTYRDTARDLTLGNIILQHRAPLLKTMLLAKNVNYDLPQAILYAEQEYNKFRNKFIRKLTDVSNSGLLQYVDPIIDPEQWVTEILCQLQHDKSVKSPFAYNRIGGDQYFIPPTPTALGILPASIPIMTTSSTNVPMIQGHDGSLTIAYNDWRDNVILQLETMIYNHLPDKFKTDDRPVFDIQQWIGNRFYQPGNGYSYSEFNAIMIPMFELWTQTNHLDYRINNGYKADDPFTWNYNGMFDVAGNPLPGHWQDIYQWYYGTDSPDSKPWEMLGFVSQPSWWIERYGTPPYTRDNVLLWNDLEYGIIAFGTRLGTDIAYARPGLADLIPVDSWGILLDPVAIGIVSGNASINIVTGPWHPCEGPIQTLWLNSPSYRFALAIAGFLMKPARFVEECWDTVNIGFVGKQWVGFEHSSRPFNRPQNASQYVFGETTPDGSISTITGISQWISDYLASSGHASTDFGVAIRNLDVQIMHPMAGFVSLDNVKAVADNFGLIPIENITNVFYDSPVLNTETYSGIILQWTGHGWQVIGYDARNPFFTIIPPDILGPKTIIKLGENEPSIVPWHSNTYYPTSVLIVYQTIVYEAIRSHTSGPNFELTFWKDRPDLAAALVQAPRVVSYQKGLSATQQVPYGTEFITFQDIADFLLGWERWLVSRGWIFDTIEPYSGQLRNWSMAVKEFMTWAQVKWAPGNFIALSPGMQGLKFSTQSGEILDVESNFTGFCGLMDRSGKPISKRNAVVNRLDGDIILSAKNADIFSARLEIASIEHMLVFDNVTIFNDIIYLPLFNQRQPRLRLICNRSRDWTGRMDAPGFIIMNDRLKSNFEKAANDIRFAFDIELSDRQDLHSYARHLIGFQHRDYFENLLLSETEQIEFYQGMVQQKGAPRVFNKLMRSNRASNHTNLFFLEEWAVKVGKFGAPDDPIVSFQLSQIDTRTDPQIIRFASSSPQDWIGFSDNDPRWIDSPKNTNFFDMGYSLPKVPTAGPIRLNEIQNTAFHITDLPSLYIPQQYVFPTGSLIWVYEGIDGTYTVLRSFDTGMSPNAIAKIRSPFEVDLNSNDSDVTTTRLYLQNPVTLTTDDIGCYIVIDGWSQVYPELQGLQIIADIASNYIDLEIVSTKGYDFTSTIDPSGFSPTAPIVRVLREIRFADRTALATAIANASLSFAIGDLVWIDNDINGLWSVLQWDGSVWTIRRSQPSRTDPSTIVETVIYEHTTRILNREMLTDEPIVDDVIVIDPLAGIFAGVAAREIDFQTDYDPACYNIDTTNPWGAAEVGRVWWDQSTVKFLDPFTDIVGISNDRDIDELNYRKNNWSHIAPKTSVDIYEWTESSLSPTAYVARSKDIGSTLGVIYKQDNPLWAQAMNYQTGSITYYFWVKNLTITPNVPFRHMDISSVAMAIQNPWGLNLSWMAPINSDTLIVSGVSQFLNDETTAMKVRLNHQKDSDPQSKNVLFSDQTQIAIDCNFSAPDGTSLEDYVGVSDTDAIFTNVGNSNGYIANNTLIGANDIEYLVSGVPLGPSYSVQFHVAPTDYKLMPVSGNKVYAIGRADSLNNGYRVMVVSTGAAYQLQFNIMGTTSTVVIDLGTLSSGYYTVTLKMKLVAINMPSSKISVLVQRSSDNFWLMLNGTWSMAEATAILIDDEIYQNTGRVLIGGHFSAPTMYASPTATLPNVSIGVGDINLDVILPNVSIGMGNISIDLALPNVSIGTGVYNAPSISSSYQVAGVSSSGQAGVIRFGSMPVIASISGVAGNCHVGLITITTSLSRLSTSGNRIVDSNGTTVILKGVNWNGGEGSTFLPLGLWQRDYKAMIDQVASFGMNCIRLPLSCAMNDTVMNSGGLVTYLMNTDLIGLTALQIMDKVINYAGSKGIWVFLDCHRVTAGNGTDSALSSGTLTQITTWWQTMATRYAANPTVCGADLYNEPYTVDWNTLAGYYEQIGNAIHAIAPNWLILCEGGTLPTGTPNGAWWGAALMNWTTRPVSLTIPNKVVASPHEYGHSVSQQVWLESTSNLSVAGWPNNLDTVWANNWAYLHTNNTVPILIGEYGGRMGFNPSTGAIDLSQADASYEVQWFNHLMAYMTTNGISSTFWTLTSESGDTGGLLNSDDATVQSGKLALMSSYLA